MKKMIVLLLTLFTIQGFAQEVSKEYDRIGKFHNGIALVWKNGKVGLIKQSGKELVSPEYDRIGAFGSDALAFTVKDGKEGVLNSEGKVIVPNIYESVAPFRGSYAITKKDGLYGMVNKQGKVVIENKYEKIKVGRYGDIRAIKEGKEVMLDIKD
ncbi:MAG TPA: WG repeat-containing protein [Ferruginibacter sp.]|nr:WG repeat-containing protein [Ferruginibacter sp.]